MKTHVYMMGLSLLGYASVGWGQEQPASSVPPSGYDLDDYEGMATELDRETPPEGPFEREETWESFTDLARASSLAEDITDGVRVEDIVEPPSDYRYAAFGKDDPFVPPMVTEAVAEAANGAAAIEIPIVSLLQRHELSALRVVGIYSGAAGQRKALVVTPEGGQAAVAVKVGDPIGNRGGKVLAVGEQAITVREFTLAADGTRQYEDLEMFLGVGREETQAARIRFEPGKPTTEIIDDQGDLMRPVATDAALMDEVTPSDMDLGTPAGKSEKPQEQVATPETVVVDPEDLPPPPAGMQHETTPSQLVPKGLTPQNIPGNTAKLDPSLYEQVPSAAEAAGGLQP